MSGRWFTLRREDASDNPLVGLHYRPKARGIIRLSPHCVSQFSLTLYVVSSLAVWHIIYNRRTEFYWITDSQLWALIRTNQVFLGICLTIPLWHCARGWSKLRELLSDSPTPLSTRSILFAGTLFWARLITTFMLLNFICSYMQWLSIVWWFAEPLSHAGFLLTFLQRLAFILFVTCATSLAALRWTSPWPALGVAAFGSIVSGFWWDSGAVAWTVYSVWRLIIGSSPAAPLALFVDSCVGFAVYSLAALWCWGALKRLVREKF